MSLFLLSVTDTLNNPALLAFVLFIATLVGVGQTVWFYKITQKSKGQSRHSGDVIYLLMTAGGTIACGLVAVVLLLYR